MTEAPPWTEIAALHVLRRLGRLTRERLGVGLWVATRSGTPPEPWLGAAAAAAAHVLAAGRGLRTRGGRTPAKLDEAAGLAVAPVDASGHRVGYVVADGFVVGTGAGDPRRPRLSPADAGWLLELVRAAAAEAGSFLEQLGGGDDGPDRDRYGDIIGASVPMQRVYRVLDKLAGSDATVVVSGENGTGKELVARAIHDSSARRAGPFVAQNCSALNDNLLDSELFGHRRGAFTGAVGDKQGLFAVADGGTFFLDEIADTSPMLQAKLLRVLQEGTFLPVGDTRPRHVDVRVVAATHQDLAGRVAGGSFRQDLYFRLHVITVPLPPLRRRGDDILLLVEHFLARAAGGRRVGRKRLDAEAEARLLAYGWPGNVRELENEVERLVVLTGDRQVIGVDLLSPRVREGTPWGAGEAAPPTAGRTLPDAVRSLERSMIADALRRCHGNKTQAARALGVSRRNLIRKVRALGLEREGGG